METDESMLSLRSKRVTVDFSLLSVPCVPESALQPVISLQVQKSSSLLGVSHLGMLECV